MTLCTEELFLSTQKLQLFLHIRWSILWGGEGYGWSTQHIWRARQGLTPPSQTSQQVTRLPIIPVFFIQLLFPTGLLVHQRTNANGNDTKWFIFLKQYIQWAQCYREYLHFLLEAMHVNLLCASSPSEAMMGWSSLTSCHFPILSCLSTPPYLSSTDAHCPHLGDPAPSPPRWRPFSRGPRTLPHRGSEQLFCDGEDDKDFLSIRCDTSTTVKMSLNLLLKLSWAPENLDSCSVWV